MKIVSARLTHPLLARHKLPLLFFPSPDSNRDFHIRPLMPVKNQTLLSPVPIRVLLLPVPAAPAHVINIVFRMPAQLTVSLERIRIADGNIAGTACLDDVGNGDAAGLFKGVDQIQHATAATGA